MAVPARISRRSLPLRPALRRFRLPSSTVRCPVRRQTLYTITPNFKDGYAINSSIQITRQLSTNDALTVGYANAGGRNLEFLRNINLINPNRFPGRRPSGLRTCRSAATRANPLYNNIALQDIGDNSSYQCADRQLPAPRCAEDCWSTLPIPGRIPSTMRRKPTATIRARVFISDPTNRNRDRGNSAHQPAQCFHAQHRLDADREARQPRGEISGQ